MSSARSLAIVILLLGVNFSRGGSISLISSGLRADVVEDISTIGGGPSNHKEGHDTGDLAKQHASAQATASVELHGTIGASTGNANAAIKPSGSAILFDGEVDTTLYLKSTPFTGMGSAMAATEAHVHAAQAGSYEIAYDATLFYLDPSEVSLTLALLNSGGGNVTNLDITSPVSGTRTTGKRVVDLEAGDYSLKVNASAVADPVKINSPVGDSTEIIYHASFAPQGSTPAVPLPAAVGPGALVLGAALLLKIRRQLR